MTTKKTTDLYVTTKNELGSLSRLTTPLKTNNINVENYVAWEEGNTAHFRFVTNDNAKTRELWTKEGYTVKEDPVVLWNTTNTPGTLNKGSTALAEGRVNTSCTYATTNTGNNTTTAVFYTDNPDRARDILDQLR
jgi:hypothetical protein